MKFAISFRQKKKVFPIILIGMADLPEQFEQNQPVIASVRIYRDPVLMCAFTDALTPLICPFYPAPECHYIIYTAALLNFCYLHFPDGFQIGIPVL